MFYTLSTLSWVVEISRRLLKKLKNLNAIGARTIFKTNSNKNSWEIIPGWKISTFGKNTVTAETSNDLSKVAIPIVTIGITRPLSKTVSVKQPKIILEPSFAVTVSELKQKVKGNWKIFNNSALVVRNDIKIERDLCLNGYLTIENDQVDNLVCDNKQRMKFVLLKPGEGENYEQIRGYTVTLVLDNNNKI